MNCWVHSGQERACVGPSLPSNIRKVESSPCSFFLIVQGTWWGRVARSLPLGTRDLGLFHRAQITVLPEEAHG